MLQITLIIVVTRDFLKYLVADGSNSAHTGIFYITINHPCYKECNLCLLVSFLAIIGFSVRVDFPSSLLLFYKVTFLYTCYGKQLYCRIFWPQAINEGSTYFHASFWGPSCSNCVIGDWLYICSTWNILYITRMQRDKGCPHSRNTLIFWW